MTVKNYKCLRGGFQTIEKKNPLSIYLDPSDALMTQAGISGAQGS
jgi:hypothetical protein